MLTQDQIELIWQMDTICHRCIRAGEYFKALTCNTENLWSFTQNCYGEIAALLWCQLFHRYKEPTHYSQLFKPTSSKPIEAGYSKEKVKDRLLKKINLNGQEYGSFGNDIIYFRNKYVAHREYTAKSLKFPDLDKVIQMCEEMREILREFVNLLAKGSGDSDLRDLKAFLDQNNNNELLAQLKREASHLVIARDTPIRGRIHLK